MPECKQVSYNYLHAAAGSDILIICESSCMSFLKSGAKMCGGEACVMDIDFEGGCYGN